MAFAGAWRLVMNVHQQSAHEIARQVRAGILNAVAVCVSALDQIERLGSERSGFTRIFRQRALLRAAAVDKIVAAGLDPGPLAGVPFGAADLFDVAAQVTTAGSLSRASAPLAHRDAKVIALLEAAGAVLVGTQNMDEFGYGFVTQNAGFGTTLNPHDPERVAGGAAGGSAVAVATGCVPVSLAFDTNGSLRVPAALCGVIGLKPTYGDLPRDGSFPFVDSLDTIGPIARDLDDIVLVRDILRAGRGETVVVPRAPIRFARLGGWFDRNMGEEYIRPFDRLADVLGKVCYQFEYIEMARAAASLIIAAEGANLHRRALRRDPMAYPATTRDRLLAGLLMPADSYLEALRFRAWMRERPWARFDQCDIVFSPAAPGYAPVIADPTMEFDGERVPARSHLGIYTQPISLIGLPALVLPLDHDGPLPLGIQLIATSGGEPILFEAARFLNAQGLVKFPKPTDS